MASNILLPSQRPAQVCVNSCEPSPCPRLEGRCSTESAANCLSNTSERPDLNFNTVFQANLGDQAQPLRVVTPTQDISERSHR
eukprot:symbB.v1.2.031772.t1/scaffold3680.1/size54306/2